MFVFSAQVLVYAYISHLYPPAVRGTALGAAAGVGRVGAIVGLADRWLAALATGIAYPGASTRSRSAAVLAVVALATVPHTWPPPTGVGGHRDTSGGWKTGRHGRQLVYLRRLGDEPRTWGCYAFDEEHR